ncbi:MAG: response regulator [Armatimonadetes bacterium]|nr:response regulator [Armatimonadota bacterium]
MLEPQNPVRPKVLVVDDEVDLVELISEALTDEGWEVVTATSVAEAERSLKTMRPDLVLADVYFREGPCWPFLASLRWLQPAPIVVLMTAFAAAFDEREQALADAVLAKPFRLSVMMALLKQLLGLTSDNAAE